MLTDGTPEIGPLCRRVLEHEAGDRSDPAGLADAAERVSQRLYHQFRPFVGPLGFRAIVSKALDMSKEEFSFLEKVHPSEEGAMTMRGLCECVETEDAAVVRAGIESLLCNVLNILVGMLGSKVTYRSLREAWPELEIP